MYPYHACASSTQGASEASVDIARRSFAVAMTTRIPLNDGENLAVGAFGGIVETCVQSASRCRRGMVKMTRDGWMD